MSIEKRKTHSFTIKATRNDDGSTEIIEVSARVAYTAVFEELEKIEKNLKELTKEFFDLWLMAAVLKEKTEYRIKNKWYQPAKVIYHLLLIV